MGNVKQELVGDSTGERRRYYLTESLRTYYNASSYVIVSPGFTYKLDDGDTLHDCKKPRRSYQIVLIALQVCSLITVLIADFYLSKYSFWNEPKRSKSEQAFQILLSVFWALNTIVLYYTFSARSHGITKLLDTVCSIERKFERAELLPQRSYFVKYLAQCFITLAILWSFFSFIFASYELHAYSIEDTLRDQVYGLQDIFKKGTEETTAIGANEDDKKQLKNETISLPTWYFTLSVGCLLAKVKDEIAFYYALCALLVQAVVFYIIVRDFVSHLKDNNMQQKSQVLAMFEEICHLCALMDQNMGPTVGFAFLDILTYFADLINEVATFKWTLVIQGILYAFSRGLFLVLAAEANSKLGYLKLWLQKALGLRAVAVENSGDLSSPGKTAAECKGKDEELERLLIVLSQLQSNQIGIRGRVFTITYCLMFSLLLNYTILLSQIKSL